MDRPLEIRDVENISPEASDDNSDIYPQLVAPFTCQNEAIADCIVLQSLHVCCSVIRMINVTHAAIEGISVTVRTPHVSVVVLQQCSHLHFQSITFSSIQGQDYDSNDFVSNECGNVAQGCSDIEIDSLEVSNFSCGVWLYKSRNTSMTNVSAAHNVSDGIVMWNSTDTSMKNVSAVHNGGSGIFMMTSTNTSIMTNVSAAHNWDAGIYLWSSTDTSMMNVSAAHNNLFGIFILYSTNTSMTNVSGAYNGDAGIYLWDSTDTTLMNISAAHNGDAGIVLRNSTDSSMTNVSAAHNDCFGIFMTYSTDTNITNISAAHNGDATIYLRSSTFTSITNLSAAHNGYAGIILWSCTDTCMTNVSVAHNVLYGIFMRYSTDTSTINISAAENDYFGIFMTYSTNTNMTNIYAAHNGDAAIYLQSSTFTSMTNVSAAHNGDTGIYLRSSTDISMTNVSAAHNRNTGVAMWKCTNSNMINLSATHNGDTGISMVISADTSFINVSAAHNEIFGVLLYYSTDINLMNVSAVHNQHSDIELINIVNTHITNTAYLITAYNTKNIVLNETSFSNMDAPSTASSTSEPTSLPAIITLYSSTLNIRDCNFTRNSISSIKAIGSNVTMSGKVLFHNNTASSGTVLIFAKNSLLTTTDNSNIQFQKNYAINYGGVFYITTEESYETSMSLQDIIEFDGGGYLITSRTECFVHVEGSRSHARLTFINNTAGKGGDVLYGGLVALGYDGDWNCLLSFQNISNMSLQSGLSLISSAPSRVCLCNGTGQPDCLTVADSTTHVIYPGQTITISAVVVGQDFGTVTGSVFAHFLHPTDSVHMEQKQDNIAVEQSQCSNLEYTIFSQSEESAAVLVLTHNDKETSQFMNKEDNQEITITWEILNKEPIYTNLAYDIICDFINFTSFQFTIKYEQSNLPGNHTIGDFNKFTPAYIYTCESAIHTKFVLPKEIYSYPVYINVSFCPCPDHETAPRSEMPHSRPDYFT